MRDNAEDSATWHIVGIARYRNGDFRGAISALELAQQIGVSLRRQTTSGFFLAMAYWQLAKELEARMYLREAIEALGTDKGRPGFDLLPEIRTEAESLLKIGKAGTTGSHE